MTIAAIPSLRVLPEDANTVFRVRFVGAQFYQDEVVGIVQTMSATPVPLLRSDASAQPLGFDITITHTAQVLLLATGGASGFNGGGENINVLPTIDGLPVSGFPAVANVSGHAAFALGGGAYLVTLPPGTHTVGCTMWSTFGSVVGFDPLGEDAGPNWTAPFQLSALVF